MKKKKALAFLALLTGAVIGVIFGFLYEPSFSKETINRIKDEISEIKERIREI